ncbi:MAG: hypothetical protein IPH13_06645 [Planctomycetes bacterium]|nr:hypothetical protein [Planctomycetota bacterium]MCC7172084.1 hypothetical protein [Planctomycetota bacterium]
MATESRSPLDPACSRASTALIAAFPRDLDRETLAALESHCASCSTCAAEFAQARDQELLLRAWSVPAPSSRSTDRFVAAIAIDGAQRAVCARKREALEHALRDERFDPQVAALRAHVATCAHCAEAWSTDHVADRLLRAWPAPTPPHGFVDAVLARLRVSGLLHGAPLRMRMAWAAAAAILLGTFAWLGFGVLPAPTSPPVAVVDVEHAIDRFGGDVHVVNVMNAQFPAGIGSFAPTAVALERAPSQPGAGFHRALRKVRRDAAGGDQR